jgi:hypothetical protein
LQIVIGCACSCVAAVVHAQQKNASSVASRPQPAIDCAVEYLQRETEAAIEQRDKEFARLKAHAAHLENQHVGVRLFDTNGLPVPFPGGVPHQKGRWPIGFAPVRAEETAEDGDDQAGSSRLIAREAFDLTLFGTTGDIPSARDHLETLLTRKIDGVDRLSRITPMQQRKLLLAGRGDIKRLLDRVEDERKKFEKLRTDPARCEEFLEQLRPLSMRLFRGPFGSESLFAKTLKKLRNEENLVRGEQERQEHAPER